MESLSVTTIENGVVYPTIRVASHPGKLLMGVYDGDGTYVEGSALDRRSGERGAPVPRDLFPAVTDSPVPEAIYLGPLYFHFGHFLLESLARTWYAHRHPEVPIVWAGAHTWQSIQLKPWQQEILDILEIGNPVQIAADPLRFEHLRVPDIGYRYDDRFHPEHASFLGRYQGPVQIPRHRLWLSRSKAGDVRDLNAAPTERRLGAAGWTIAYPETLTIRQQLDLLARAEIVAGEEGSAFHSLILLQDVTAKRFRIFRRHGPEHGSMRTIGDARQVDQTFYTLESELVLKAEGRVVSKLNPNSSEILDRLEVTVPDAADPATRPASTPILERVVADLAPDSFLEVGAAAPFLIIGSTAPIRVAVAPRFGFDPRSYADSGVDFYELDLARYVDNFHGDRDPFDVIRLAGSKFESVMAAFRISQRVAHEDTVWVLGRGDLGARVALAIQLTHPGFVSRRLLVQRTIVYVARRAVGRPADEAGVAALSADEVRKGIRWLPVRRSRRRKQQPVSDTDVIEGD